MEIGPVLKQLLNVTGDFVPHGDPVGAPSKLKNGKKSDIVHKGGRRSDQNHSFELLGKNDISLRRDGGLDIFITIKSLDKCKAIEDKWLC